MHLAAVTGDVELAEKTQKSGEDVLNVLNDDEETPLYLAVINKKTAIVEFLIKSGADLEKPKKSVTPLQEACQRGLEDIVKLLIDAKAQVQKSDGHGFSALNFAHWAGHENIVKLLLEHNATQQDLEAKLPFHAEIEANQCTATSSKEPALQQWVQCETCNVVSCVSCAKKSHGEHKVSTKGFGWVVCVSVSKE